MVVRLRIPLFLKEKCDNLSPDLPSLDGEVPQFIGFPPVYPSRRVFLRRLGSSVQCLAIWGGGDGSVVAWLILPVKVFEILPVGRTVFVQVEDAAPLLDHYLMLPIDIENLFSSSWVAYGRSRITVASVEVPEELSIGVGAVCVHLSP